MAGNNTSPSQAEQAARVNKNRKGAASANKNAAAVSRRPPSRRMVDNALLSAQSIMAFISLCLLILFAVMALNPEGRIPQLLRDLLLWLFGQGAFYLSIPGLLFLFISFVHRSPKNVWFKTYCTLGFVLFYGILHHLVVNDATYAKDGLEVVGTFGTQGITGNSGGVVCGFIGFLLRWAFGKGLAFLIVAVAMLLLLLGAVDLTIPGILRAVQNNPRLRREENVGDKQPSPDAAERVVDFAVDVHSRVRQSRAQRREAREREAERYYKDEEDDEDWDNPLVGFFAARKAEKAEKLQKKQQKKQQKEQADPEDRMSQFDIDIGETEPAARPDAEFAEPVPPVEKDPAVRKVTSDEAAASAAEVAAEIEKGKKIQKAAYSFPPIDLLKLPGRSNTDGTAEMKRNSARLNETLASFKIDAHIINVTRGPSVTRYEVELDKGVRLNKLTTVADDIALSLGVMSVRIAPVPGKISVVGIEVPNQAVTNVNLREVIDSREFHRSASKSTFAVGKDIVGTCIVGNIAKMPHMLIAGTTGSGKSVCMNSIIISLLYKASPEDVKLIMVDPKMVELGIYNDIPHLLIPVVTDPKKAAGSLQWAVTEMMRRYKLMSDSGVRDLESFNSIVEAEEDGEKLPQVVIIIDELADLMLVAAKEVEDSICRIAQMGRAAGMHLIIATQRPSADVITGLMKANIPSRIAFSVASAMESRIILDTTGAEKLVGKGDMLFAPIGIGKPQRVQGCFVTDAEVEAVASFVKENYKASYDESVMDEIEKTAIQTGKKGAPAPEPEANGEELEHDEMLVPAVDVIMETQQASVSMLQRRLKLGYARAARIVDELEELGVVGPFQGSKPRAIQITKEQWEEMKAAGWPDQHRDSAAPAGESV